MTLRETRINYEDRIGDTYPPGHDYILCHPLLCESKCCSQFRDLGRRTGDVPSHATCSSKNNSGIGDALGTLHQH
jgi:hypothetical protein